MISRMGAGGIQSLAQPPWHTTVMIIAVFRIPAGVRASWGVLGVG
jgi:hypothetical protein